MAVGWTNLFTRIGKFIKYLNTRKALAVTTWPAEVTAINDLYESGDVPDIIEGLQSLYRGFQDGVTAQRQQLAQFITRTLTDRDTVISQLTGLVTTDLTTVFRAIFDQMTAETITITKNTVTVGSTTPNSGNTGTGIVLLTKVLDGYNAPLQGGMSHLAYNTLNSELGVTSETMEFRCTADSVRDGTTEGAEQFSWIGGLPGPALDWESEGSGQGPGLVSANEGHTIITDGALENWTNTNTPSNWTIGNGTAGTHIFRESSTIFRGTYSLKFLGTGAQATMGIEQSVSPSLLTGRRRYLVGVRLRAASVPAAGQIEMHFSGTGYTKTSPTPEVQTLQISGTPTGGTYTITVVAPWYGSQTTGTIAYNATSATVQTALRALRGFEAVVVSTSAGAPPDVTHTITFRGVVGDIAQLTADITLLTGGTPAKTIATTTAGVEGDCIILPAAAFPTSSNWFFGYFWINLPSVIPSDWKLVLQVASTLSNTVALYADAIVFAPAVYHGGVGAVVVSGSTRWIAGDKVTATIANDNAGVFGKFLREAYSVQLPSSAAPSISDALAT